MRFIEFYSSATETGSDILSIEQVEARQTEIKKSLRPPRLCVEKMFNCTNEDKKKPPEFGGFLFQQKICNKQINAWRIVLRDVLCANQLFYVQLHEHHE